MQTWQDGPAPDDGQVGLIHTPVFIVACQNPNNAKLFEQLNGMKAD